MSLKKITALLAVCACAIPPCVFAQWKPAGEKLKTIWADKVDPANPLPEYPRPLMQRAQWQNLNGLWDYAITAENAPRPATFDGQILVPFAVESALSGVMKPLGKDQALWYQRVFSIPQEWSEQDVLLNFGAVDWRADVFVNGVKVGEHTGGYAPFSLNITKALKPEENTLVVRVWDGTDTSLKPRGKQVLKPKGIYYTAVSGIWQTVWLEPVPSTHLTRVKTTPNLDAGRFEVEVQSNAPADRFRVLVFENEKQIAQGEALCGARAFVEVVDPKLWSPDSPFLYDLKVELIKDGAPVDSVESYAAMRKISISKPTKHKYARLQLNNQNIYHMGPLDQGYWPDGLYTAPTEEALLFDIEKTKELGFNMIRKHVKVEPARWYYHCDRLGMLVWQDMPHTLHHELTPWVEDSYVEVEGIAPPEMEADYRKEWKEIIDALYSHPCIVMWVPFNENWGQFKTKEIAQWTKSYDPTRPVNPASGGNYFLCGDILDIHSYPAPRIKVLNSSVVNAIGEYGGIGLVVRGHIWDGDMKNWGYVQFKNSDEATAEYEKFSNMLADMTQYGI